MDTLLIIFIILIIITSCILIGIAIYEGRTQEKRDEKFRQEQEFWDNEIDYLTRQVDDYFKNKS